MLLLMDSCIGEQVKRSKRYCNNPRPKNGGRHYSASGVRVLSKSSLLPGKNYNDILVTWIRCVDYDILSLIFELGVYYFFFNFISKENKQIYRLIKP